MWKIVCMSFFILVATSSFLYGQDWEIVQQADWGVSFWDMCFVDDQEGWTISVNLRRIARRFTLTS